MIFFSGVFFPLVPELSPQLAPKLPPQLAPKLAPQLARRWLEIGPKLARNRPKIGPNLARKRPETDPKSNRPKIDPKTTPNRPQTDPKSTQNWNVNLQACAEPATQRPIPCHQTGKSVFQKQTHRVAGPCARDHSGYERHDYLPVTALELGLSRQNDAWSEAQVARNVKESVSGSWAR